MLSKRPVWFTLAFLALAAGCKEDPALPDPNPNPDPDPDPVEEGYDFVYDPPAGAPNVTSVVLRGEFNQWGPPNGTDVVLQEQTDGSWVGSVDLDSTTTYQYKFVINGGWVPNMCSDETWGHASAGYMVHLDADGCVDDGLGGMNAVINLSEEPGLSFSHSASDPAFVSVAGGRLSVRFHARRDMVESARLAIGGDTIDMHLQLEVGLNEVWRASAATTAGSYEILLETTEGAEEFGPYTVPAAPFTSVSWAGDAVAYQIFPERFWNGDPSNDSLTLSTDEYEYNELWTSNGPTLASSWDAAPNNQHCCHQYYGGDLQGIVDRLYHLEDLGVTVLYLNPIWHSGSAHGYDASDYTMLAPEFGDSTMLRTFLDAAHAAGMRVIWDFVPNHVGLGFWAFQDAVKNGEASPYWNWFQFKVPAGQVEVGHGGHYDSWWGFGSLPRLQTRNPQVSKHLLDAARHWTAFGFDGIRVDVPNEIANRSEFFPAFRQATKAINPEVYLVGEIWERDPSWLKGDQFDALMNYALGSGVIERFAKGGMTGGGAEHELAQIYATYPEASVAMQFNLISSHDTDRLLTKMGGGVLGGTADATALARHRLASAMLYAVPGMPVTFQGDECAFLGSGEGPREENRYPMQWSTCDASMVAHYARLAELKRTVGAISSPVIRAYRSAGPLLSFYRGEPGPGEVLAVFNNAPSTQTLVLPVGSWTDALSGQLVSGSAEIAALGWRFLERR